MGYDTQYANAQNQDFVGRVCIAALKYAMVVRSELLTTPGHKSRVRLARNIANDPVTMTQKMAYIISSDPSVVGASDETLNTLVASVWDTFSGEED